jgi:TatA/E family protein of Tat protein translocase
MFGGLSPAHLLIILIIALIVVGPGKLPEVGAAIGKSVREFQKATGPVQEALTGGILQSPQAHAPQVAVQPPTQAYYAAQPVYAAPVYPAPATHPPMQYQPVAGVVEPAPAQPTPITYPQPDAGVQLPPSAPQVD